MRVNIPHRLQRWITLTVDFCVVRLVFTKVRCASRGGAWDGMPLFFSFAFRRGGILSFSVNFACVVPSSIMGGRRSGCVERNALVSAGLK